MAKDEASPARIAIIEEWDAWAKKHPEKIARTYIWTARVKEELANKHATAGSLVR